MAWDYIADKSSNDVSSAAVRVALHQGRIGIGSGIVRCNVLKRSTIRHLPQSVLTKQLEDRVHETFQSIANVKTDSLQLIHELLQVVES